MNPVILVSADLRISSPDPTLEKTYDTTGKKQATNSRVRRIRFGRRAQIAKLVDPGDTTRSGNLFYVEDNAVPNGHKFRHVGPSTFG